MMEVVTTDVVENLKKVQQQVVDAVARAPRGERSADEITLVAVSKTKPFALIQALYESGHRNFGENRVEEALQKVALGTDSAMDELNWHMIGTVQSRKSREVVGPFSLLHSVDKEKLANRLSRDAVAANHVLSVLLQVNVSGEESKQGFTAEELESKIATLSELPNVQIQGLMTMAPFVADPEETRPVFRRLRELRDRLNEANPTLNIHELSMGMTNDFEVAIEEGATIVRVGSAIFGTR